MRNKHFGNLRILMGDSMKSVVLNVGIIVPKLEFLVGTVGYHPEVLVSYTL